MSCCKACYKMVVCRTVQRVKNQMYLYRRGDAFVFRRGVPAAPRKAFGKNEVFKSLNARTVSDASFEILPHLREFEARLRRSKIASGDLRGETPSLQQIETSVREWFAACQERFERYEKSGKSEEARKHRLLELEEYESEARAAIRGEPASSAGFVLFCAFAFAVGLVVIVMVVLLCMEQLDRCSHHHQPRLPLHQARGGCDGAIRRSLVTHQCSA